MTKREAKEYGKDSGYEAGMYGDFTEEELSSQEVFESACYEICENKRQYAGSITYDMAGLKNSDGLFDAFDEGESIGIRLAWRERHGEK